MKHIIPFGMYKMLTRGRGYEDKKLVDMYCNNCNNKIEKGNLYFCLKESHYCYMCYDILEHYV